MTKEYPSHILTHQHGFSSVLIIIVAALKEVLKCDLSETDTFFRT